MIRIKLLNSRLELRDAMRGDTFHRDAGFVTKTGNVPENVSHGVFNFFAFFRCQAQLTGFKCRGQ